MNNLYCAVWVHNERAGEYGLCGSPAFYLIDGTAYCATHARRAMARKTSKGRAEL